MGRSSAILVRSGKHPGAGRVVNRGQGYREAARETTLIFAVLRCPFRRGRHRPSLRRHSGTRRLNSGLPEFSNMDGPSRQQPTWMARTRNPFGLGDGGEMDPGLATSSRPGMTDGEGWGPVAALWGAMT